MSTYFSEPHELRQYALQCLLQTLVTEKVAAVLHPPGTCTVAPHIPIDSPHHPVPGHPARPVLVAPQQLSHRSVHTEAGLIGLLHAVCHIEFNAIQLALDAVWRFAHMPVAYYRDWWGVAQEECQHFVLLERQLQLLGAHYGDLPAHNGLWDMCEQTRHDVLARMALVPRLLEARGLDVTPGIQSKLRASQNSACADVLDIILRDEIGHVRVGNHWFHRLCDQRQLDPIDTFADLMAKHQAPHIRPPLNQPARQCAGFSAAEMAWLEGKVAKL